jgi:CheY-like chemotaxis protein
MKSCRCLLFGVPLLALVGALLAPALGQDLVDPKKKQAETRKEAIKKVIEQAQEEYRIFFKEPKTVLEYWAAMKFEMQVGKFDIAAYHLDKLNQLVELKNKGAQEDELLKLEENKQLLQIEEVEGLNTLLKLKLIKQWSKNHELQDEAVKNVEVLIDRTMVLLEKHLGSAARLSGFIDSLSDKVPEIRNYAYYQIKRAKHRATPLLVEALRSGKNTEIIKQTMLKLDDDIIPPLLEVLKARNKGDAEDKDLRLALLHIIKYRYDKRAVPYLWHMSESTLYPPSVRAAAKDTLATLLNTKIQPRRERVFVFGGYEKLLPAKVALVQLAERYYQNKVRYNDLEEMPDRDDPIKKVVVPAYKIWFVDNNTGQVIPKAQILLPDEARFAFGLRYAKEALDLDKQYIPAQVIYLSFLLEAEFTRKPYDGQLDKLLTEKRPPALARLLAKIDYELLITVLERALAEHNYAVMLPLIDALGDRGEVRAAMPTSAGAPGALVRALYYPDRRVQYAAARALLKLPSSPSPSPVASARVVEVLRRFLAAEPAPKVLIAFARDARAAELRQVAEEAGFKAEVAVDTREAIQKLRATAEYDAILIDESVPIGELPFALAQLRTDQDAGRLPLLVVAPPDRKAELARMIERSPNTFLLEAVWAKKAANLKKQLHLAIKYAAAPDTVRNAPEDQRYWLDYEIRRAKGQMLSENERKYFAQAALDWFALMARGELAGYDLKPVKATLEQMLNDDNTAIQALRIVARFPGPETQKRLFGVLTNTKRPALHLVAAQELNRHIQKHGMALTSDQILQVRQMEARKDLLPAVRAELSILVGTLGSSSAQTGARLFQYEPDPPMKEEKQ